jgi:magnesium transporter
MEDLVHSAESNMTADLYKIQKQVSLLHRSVWPNRDVINELQRTENKLVREKTQIFIKDIHDHTLQVLDLVDSFRENINALMEISISYSGDRLNRIMKFLTLVSTIFIPLTFIAGIYGMNFSNMPELGTRYGYFIVLGVMAVIFAGMLVLFKRRKWF